jgi:uncharacterized protein YggE
MTKSPVIAAVMLLIPSMSFALETAAPPNCEMSQTSTVTLNVNNSGTDIVALRDGLNKEIDDVSGLSRTAGIQKLEMQSVNYNIRPPGQYSAASRRAWRSNGGEGPDEYTLTGTVMFKAQPSEKGAEFMALLVKKGYQASLGVNGYRTYNCGQAPSLGNIIPSMLPTAAPGLR